MQLRAKHFKCHLLNLVVRRGQEPWRAWAEEAKDLSDCRVLTELIGEELHGEYGLGAELNWRAQCFVGS